MKTLEELKKKKKKKKKKQIAGSSLVSIGIVVQNEMENKRPDGKRPVET